MARCMNSMQKTRDSAVSRCFHQKGARNSRKKPFFCLDKKSGLRDSRV